MFTNKIKTIIICALIFGVGCFSATVGRKINMEGTKNIVKNKTTKSEIKQMFGKPFEVTKTMGKLTWTYVHVSENDEKKTQNTMTKIIGFGKMNLKEDNLIIYFNEDGTVYDFDKKTTKKDY